MVKKLNRLKVMPQAWRIKYCPNCKGDLIPVPERLLFRCSDHRKQYLVAE